MEVKAAGELAGNDGAPEKSVTGLLRKCHLSSRAEEHVTGASRVKFNFKGME